MKHIDVKERVEEFLTHTETARALSERDRDYKDNKQWTEQEIAKLQSRNQAPIVVNRIRPKVEGLKGLLIQRRTDPKAYPRTKKDEKAAEVVTDGLRYVADNTKFNNVKLDVADNIFVEGYGAALIDVKEEGGKVEIDITHIPWDRYYYDIHSRKLGFTDKRWDGIILWMDIEEVMDSFELSRKKAEELLHQDEGTGFETFDDRPMWVDKKRDRIRVCQHFQIEKGVWMMSYFTSSGFLMKPIESPYLNEFGEPMNPIEAQSGNIDRENNRFGEVRYWIDLQDEINHRRSKFLHLNSVRQTAGRKGVIPDIPSMKRELAKPDGHVEYNGDKGDFEILKTGDMSDSQFLLYQDGKGELDAVGFNAQLSGERQGDLSGKAIVNLQQAAINELSSLYAGIEDWENRCFRQVWYRMRQFWGKEKWIRILDDQSNIRWVGMNQQITLQQQLEETINDESLDLPTRQQASQIFLPLMQNQDPKLQEVVEIRNDITELDIDIILTTSLDSINMQQEQFELLAKVMQTRPEIDIKHLISASELRNKDDLIKDIDSSRQAQSQAQQQNAQLEAAKTEAETQDKAASAMKKEQEAIQASIQNAQLIEDPPEDASVVI